MTKKDLNAITKGTIIGGGLAFVLWFFFRKTVSIREIRPIDVQWEK